MNPLWSCPVCGQPLHQQPAGLRCGKGHSFDGAKEGYVNLLLASRMRTKAPGDSKEMVQARHRLLEGGAYQAFGKALGQQMVQLASQQPGPLHLLDAGCGEGWYAQQVCQALCSQNRDYQLAGFDISKAAVRLAARRGLPQAQFAVASSFAIPLQQQWADVILNVFSPFAGQEFLRCLRPGGWLVYAVPTPQHLMGLKEVLYQTPYANPQQQVEYEGFTLVAEHTVEDTITLTGQAVQDLFAMTPYYWKTPLEGSQRLAQRAQLTTPIGFRFLVYQKEA